MNRLGPHLVAPRDILEADEEHGMRVHETLLPVLRRLRAAFFHAFALFEVAIDGLVATRDDFLPFTEALDDFREIVVTDAPLDRQGLDAVAVQREHDFDGPGG